MDYIERRNRIIANMEWLENYMKGVCRYGGVWLEDVESASLDKALCEVIDYIKSSPAYRVNDE